MDKFWTNFLAEIGLFTLLGVLYYFYQKKKILSYEENKEPMIMGFILQSCLSERGESDKPELDVVIEALDDYLHNRTLSPPYVLLRSFSESTHCSQELRHIILEGLEEMKKK
jgi:hypothetical protein